MKKYRFAVPLLLSFVFAACAMNYHQQSPGLHPAVPPKARPTTVTVTENGTSVSVKTHDASITVQARSEWIVWNFQGAALQNASIEFKQNYSNVDVPVCTSTTPNDWVCTSSTFQLPCDQPGDTYTYHYRVNVTTAAGNHGTEDPDIIVQK